MQPDRPIPAPARVGRFTIEDRLGAGGMGVVYVARDPELDRRVAIKLLLRERADDDAVERFRREARAMAKLTHPNVVTVHDVGEHDGRPFLAMEYVEGETLAAWMASPAWSWHEGLARCLAAGRGLAAAHAAGLVHRDFKPHNVLCAADGRVLVTDFGLEGTLPRVPRRLLTAPAVRASQGLSPVGPGGRLLLAVAPRLSVARPSAP